MNSLAEQIARLPKESWVNLQGLVDSAKAYFGPRVSKPDNDCISISFLGKGGFHRVYKLVLSDGTQLAASVFKKSEDSERFNPQAKHSEIATMKFVRESGLYPDIPVPKVHTYDTTFSNPVGAPYVLMDIVEGETLAGLENEGRSGLDALPHTQQLAVVKALAKLKASLSRAVPFTQIGSLERPTNDIGTSVGPLITLSGRNLGGPFNSAFDIWKSILDRVIGHAALEWCSNPEDEVRSSVFEPKCTPQRFTELYQLVSALSQEFKIPTAYHLLVLHHPDIALRNIFFDRESLSTDEPKITGVIDWGGSQILPLLLSAQYPADLITTAGTVNQLFGRPDEGWHSVPADWTRLGDKTKWPSYVTAMGEDYDFIPFVTGNVRKFYLRAYFSACFGEEISLKRGDASLAHRTLFRDAEFYLKFHEVVLGGWVEWVGRASWIKETYNRLKALSRKEEGGGTIIIGPNVYCSAVPSMVRNLQTFESDWRPFDESSDNDGDDD